MPCEAEPDTADGDLPGALPSGLRAELINFRRDLHMHPELGNREFRTTAAVKARLEKAGLRPRTLTMGTGLICDIGPDIDTGTGAWAGAGRPMLALRADLDALPIPDTKTVPYRSTVPRMAHACGHDVHTTAVLGAGLVLAGAYALPPLRGLVDAAIAHLPGGGMIRDAQKFVAPLALVEAVGFGAGVERLLALIGPSRWRPLAAAVLLAAPVLLEPGLAWGAAGRLGTAAYPPSWRQARRIMAADRQPGAMLVLPWHLYLGLPWNGDRVVLDPAQRYFTRRAVGNDDLELSSTVVPGEDPYGGRLGPLVRGTAPLAPALPGQGIRYVLVLKVAEWASFPPRLAGASRLLDAPDLSLYQVPGKIVPPPLPGPPDAPVLAGDLLALAVAGGAITGVLPAVALPRRRLLLFGRAVEGSRR